MTSNGELRIRAQAVSRGVAFGKAVCLFGRRRQYFRTLISPDKTEKELRRFRAAIRLAVRQLRQLNAGNGRAAAENAAGILEFHKMMLSDKVLLDQIEKKIGTEKVNAEWAVKLVTDGYLAKYKSIPDEKLRERHLDLEDVTERILAALGGGRRTYSHLEPNSVIVARELNPSTLLELSANDPVGIVTEHGGWTSHTFILAREMGIPSVTGVRRAAHRLQNGDEVIVDGFRGEIIVHPSQSTIEMYRGTSPAVRSSRSTPRPDLPLKTLDNRRIVIRANADIPGGYEKARAEGALGVGLFRSEYIFNRFRGVPTENEQYEAYRRIAELAGDHGVRIRTFDFGTEELADQPHAKCKNPALGLRAIRLSLQHERQFRDQLRAILRASFETSIDIILPMISDLSEVRRVKELLVQEREVLEKEGFPIGSPRLGVMVEVPATVLLIDRVLDEVEVICLGTNDLVQYLLAVDRDNEDVAPWFRTLSPAVINAVRLVLDACSERKVPCVVCGEMAGSPYYVPLLIGLGATELSMNPNSISRIRDLISGIAFEEAASLVREISRCTTAAETEEVNRNFIVRHWAHLFDPPPAPIPAKPGV